MGGLLVLTLAVLFCCLPATSAPTEGGNGMYRTKNGAKRTVALFDQETNCLNVWIAIAVIRKCGTTTTTTTTTPTPPPNYLLLKLQRVIISKLPEALKTAASATGKPELVKVMEKLAPLIVKPIGLFLAETLEVVIPHSVLEKLEDVEMLSEPDIKPAEGSAHCGLQNFLETMIPPAAEGLLTFVLPGVAQILVPTVTQGLKAIAPNAIPGLAKAITEQLIGVVPQDVLQAIDDAKFNENCPSI